jgi:hypothetical protein
MYGTMNIKFDEIYKVQIASTHIRARAFVCLCVLQSQEKC